MNSKSVITSTVGYMCLALTGWLLSMPNAGWFQSAYQHGTATMLPLGLVLGIMGILAFTDDRVLDAVIFFGGAGLFWSDMPSRLSAVPAGAIHEPGSYTGWYAFVWVIYFCYVWFGSFKAGLERFLFLLGLWLTLLALAIGSWASLHVITIIGGYLGLATSILAAIVSAETIIRHGFRNAGVTAGNPAPQ